MSNVFEYATRNKLRWATTRGELSVEQLWDVPLRPGAGSSIPNGFDLNTIAQMANKAVKALTEESFVDDVRTPSHIRAEMSLEVVKAIIEAKRADEATAKKRADNKVERDKLLAILAEKQDGKLSKLSEADIHKRLAALEV